MISIPPTEDISLITSGVSISFMEFDKRVIVPWYRNTGIAENATPIPSVDENIIADIPSNIDFANNVSW